MTLLKELSALGFPILLTILCFGVFVCGGIVVYKQHKEYQNENRGKES
jgi:hypothetical protein